MTLPLVTVLIPARNEERDLAACLDAVTAQDWPADRLEVVLVDGRSTDRTLEVAEAAREVSSVARFVVVDDSDGSTPANLNAGLSAANGEIVCRVDARSLIPSGYVRRCVEVLTSRPDVAVVGGAQVAVAPTESAVGRGIARALNNRWGMGLSRYRRGAASGPADTVYLGAFRTADLRAAGGWDDAFPTNQDFELNRRLGRRGVVWFDEELRVGYVPRGSLRELFRQYRRFGTWKVRYWRLTADRPRPRQLALLTAVPAAAAAWAAALVLWPTGRMPMLAAGVAGSLAVEVLGATRPRSGPAGHAVGVVAMATVAVGWLAGAWTALLGGSGRE